jgi:hypothetical protein
MKAVVSTGTREVAIRNVEDARIEASMEVLLRATPRRSAGRTCISTWGP